MRVKLEFDAVFSLLGEIANGKRVQCGRPRTRIDLGLDALDSDLGQRHPLAPPERLNLPARFSRHTMD